MLSRTTHSTLLARLADCEDTGAWEEFNRRYRELIRGFARRQGLPAGEVEDTVQDVFVQLARQMPTFEYDRERGKFRSFLKTVTVRAVFRKFRQNNGEIGQGRSDGAEETALHDADVEARWEAEWRQYHLRQAMRTIETEFGEKQLTAFRLYAVQGVSAEAAAAIVGESVDQVYQSKSRILKRVQEVIQTQVAEEG